jgi:hypothetical protein
MTEAVFQFKAIARKLNRQEQKAEFERRTLRFRIRRCTAGRMGWHLRWLPI